jgi:uracil-DNA glycosylase
MHFFLSQRPIYAEGVSVVPSIDNIFRAERLTSPDNIRAVIVGQDPYPQAGVATGLAFDSHINNRKIPYANLRIQEEIAREYPRENPPVFTTKNKKEIVGVPFEKKPHGDLSRWAIEEGVLLINISETTLLENPNAHKNYWIGFVDSLIRFVCKKNKNIVFFLWGREAQTIEKSIIGSHLVLKTSHPSYTYHNGKSGDSFAGSNHFIEANKFFASKNLPLINWNITK